MREFGFTLAEMMVVMLIMSIIMAAMAPVMTTRMKNDNSSPWKWCENKVDAYFGNSDKQIAMIGQRTVGTNESNAKLIIKANDDRPNHILFKRGNAITGQLRLENGAILLGSKADENVLSAGSILIGSGANAYTQSVAIGQGAESYAIWDVAIGYNAYAQRVNNEHRGSTNVHDWAAVAIGYSPKAYGNGVAIGNGAYSEDVAIGKASAGEKSVAIGVGSNARKAQNDTLIKRSIAIGAHSQATNNSAIAIGATGWSQNQTIASGNHSIAIGSGELWTANSYNNTKATASSSIAIGFHAEATAGNSVSLGSNTQCSGYNSVCVGANATTSKNNYIELGTSASTVNIQGSLKLASEPEITSDLRLKYVGKENLDGLVKIRALKSYNYTFKKDETKTPRVGVMAQDLQKVFPNAVKKGADGFLTIRMEDMFYALINAVKELDAKVSALTNEVRELRKENKEIMQRLKALEGR